MNEPSNAPLLDAASPEPFYQVWMKAITKPNEQSYAEIANSPDANPNKAYLWMFLVSLVSSFISAIVSVIVTSTQNTTDISTMLLPILCGVPIMSAISVLFFALGVAIIQWVASLFGGTGSYSKLVYVFAAFSAPIGLVTGLIGSVIQLVPALNLCFYALVILVGLYLQTVAVKAVNNFDWGKAVGSVLIPFFILVFVCGCLIIGSLMLLGPEIANVFSTIDPSLMP